MVRAVCKNDKKVCGSFVAYTVLILNRRWITPAIFVVLTVATGVLGIFFPAALTLFLLLLAATALLSVAIVLKLRNTVKKLTAGQFAEIVNTYVFGEDRFQIETKIGKKAETKEVLYGELVRVVERKDAFYLYVSAQLAFLIQKKNIVEGTAEDLRRLLLG